MDGEDEPLVFGPEPKRTRGPDKAPRITAETAKVLSMDDIKLGLSDMARNGEGAQRAQAYRMLMNMESATVTLPTPMTLEEEYERGSRFFKALGKEKCQVVYRRSFPTAKPIDDSDGFSIDDMTPHVKAEAMRITTLKKLNDLIPGIRPKGGVAKGYPTFQSPLKKVRFCQHQAALYLLEHWREQGGTDPPAQAS